MALTIPVPNQPISAGAGLITVPWNQSLAAIVRAINDLTAGGIPDNSLTYAKLVQAPANTVLGNPTGALANIQTITTTGTGSVVRAISPVFTTPNIGTATGNITGNAATATTAVLASTVTTNANLTGPITSVGNATSVASQTGTGSTFVMNTSPTLVTPNLGTPSAVVLTNATGTAASLTAGHVTTNANLTGPITSVGNATSVASQTGTGSTFVMDTSPTLVTPNLGTPSAVVLTNATSIPAGQLTGTATVSHGGTGVSSTTAYAVLCGGTTTTAALQSIASVGTSGQVLTSNGAGALPTFQTVANTSSFKTLTSQIFTSSGTYTPTANMVYCIVEAVGGGGGGGGVAGSSTGSIGAGGGGSGGYSRAIYSAATIGASQTVTIGALGAGGAAGNNSGSSGGNTTFGALLTSNGGTGGSFSVDAGSGGASSGGNINITGTNGNLGLSATITTIGATSGGGGSGIYGSGGKGKFSPNSSFPFAGDAASGYGAGGSGAAIINSTTTKAGGNGSAGIVIITEFLSV